MYLLICLVEVSEEILFFQSVVLCPGVNHCYSLLPSLPALTVLIFPTDAFNNIYFFFNKDFILTNFAAVDKLIDFLSSELTIFTGAGSDLPGIVSVSCIWWWLGRSLDNNSTSGFKSAGGAEATLLLMTEFSEYMIVNSGTTSFVCRETPTN